MDTKKTLILGLIFLGFVSSVSAVNDIIGLTLSGSDSQPYGQEITIETTVEGTDGIVEIYRDGVLVDSYFHCDAGCSKTYETSYTPGSGATGDHTYDAVYYEEGGDNTVYDDPDSKSYTILTDAEASDPSLDAPSDGATLSGNSVTYEYSVLSNSNYDGTVELYSDTCSSSGAFITSDTVFSSSSNSYSHDKTFSCSGTFDWYIKYVGNDGSTDTTFSDSFTIESDADQLTEFSLDDPYDGENFQADINQEYDVFFQANIGSPEGGTVEFYADGNKVGSDSSFACCSSTTASDSAVLDDGYYDYYAKFVGDDGSTTTTNTINFDIDDWENSAGYDLNSPTDGETVNSEDVTFDYDGSGRDGYIELWVDGTERDSFRVTDTSGADTYTVTGMSNGDHDAFVRYDGDDGSSDETSTTTFTVDASTDAEDTSIGLSNPSDGASFDSGETITFEGDVAGASGTVEIISDTCSSSNSQIYSTSYGGASSYVFSHDDSFNCGGTFDWYAKYTGDDGSTKTTSTRSFSQDDDASQTSLSISNPSDGASFVGTDTTISYDGSVAGNSGTVKIFSDTCSSSGSEIYSTSYGGASTLTFGTDETWNCEGTFDWYAKYIGDDGSTDKTLEDSFTIDSEASATSLTLNSPINGNTVTDENGDVTFDVTKEGYGGEAKLFIDSSGTPAKTWSLSCNACSESLSYTETLSAGSHAWNVQYVGNDGSSFTTSTENFNLETTPDADQTTLSLNRPNDGETYETENVEYNWTIDGESGSVDVYRDNSKVGSFSYDGSGSQTLSYSETLSNGDYNYYLKYVGDDGSTKSTNSRSFTVDVPLTSDIALNTPNANQEYKSLFPITVDYDFDVSGEAGSIELYRDNSVIKTFTHPKGSNLDYSFSEDFSQEGSHSYYVKYIRDSDSKEVTSSTRSFSIVQQENVNLNIASPSDGDTFDYGENIVFSYSVSSNVQGDLDLLINGSSVKTSSYLSTGSVVSYNYETNSLSGGEYNSRLKFTSNDGNETFSNYKNFSVKEKEVSYIEDVYVNYTDAESNSISKKIVADLSGNTSINDYQGVSGDTLSFNSNEWVIENISVPYQDDLVVYDSQNRNDTRSLDFDVSVKDLAGHDQNANLSYQEKNLTLEASSNAEGFTLNYSCGSNAYGNPENVEGSKSIFPDSSESVACRWSGDWLNYSSGQFDPTVSSIDIDDDLPMSSWVEINNSESVDFPSVKYPEVAPEPGCSTTNPISVSNNSEVNKTASIECDVGDSGSPSLTIDGSDYTWNTTLNVSNSLTENITLKWDTNKSNLADWNSKDAGSAEPFFKGLQSNILLAESSSDVEVRVPDGSVSGGYGEGLHPARIEYSVGSSSRNLGSGGGGGSDDPRVIKNVTGKYNWSVSAPRSEGQTFYNIVGWEGRDLGNAPTRIVVRNLGTGNFSVKAECVSDDSACDFIELSKNNISLDELENDRQVVQVEGVIPENIPEDGYRFNIVFEDTEGQELETNFRINKNLGQSLIIRFISKIFGVKEVDFDGEGGGDPVPIPLALPVMLLSAFFWIALALGLRFAHSNNMIQEDMNFVRGRLILTILVFILGFIFI